MSRPRLDIDLAGDYGNILILLAISERLWKKEGHSKDQINAVIAAVKGAKDYYEALELLALHIKLNDDIFWPVKRYGPPPSK